MNRHCCNTNILPAVVSPTKCCVNHTCTNNIVPHIHPSHTTTVNHINYQHQHYFPQTFSSVNEVTHQNFAAPPGAMPPAGGFGGGPGFGAGPGPGPGFGGFGPGFGASPFGR